MMDNKSRLVILFFIIIDFSCIIRSANIERPDVVWIKTSVKDNLDRMIWSDSLQICKNNNATLYKIPINHIINNINLDSSGSKIVSKSSKVILNYKYIYIKEKASSAFYFDTLNEKYKLLEKDSLKNEYDFSKNFIHFTRNNQFYKKEVNDYSKELKIVKIISNSNQKDTIYYYYKPSFSKVKMFNSESLDFHDGLVLYKIEGVIRQNSDMDSGFPYVRLVLEINKANENELYEISKELNKISRNTIQ